MTLYFSNIVSRLCLCVCFILLLTGCYKNPKEVSSLENQNNGTIKEHNDNYVINCFDDEFELVFYKKNGDVLFSKSYTKEPMITQIKDGLYRINNSSGSNSNYTFFVDNLFGNVSDTYFNLLYSNEELLVYLEDGVVFVTDIFDVQKKRAEIKRDFSVTAVPQSAILSTDVKENKLCIEYLKGNTYERVYEEILLE